MNLPNTKPNQYDLAWYIRECEALQNENAALRERIKMLSKSDTKQTDEYICVDREHGLWKRKEPKDPNVNGDRLALALSLETIQELERENAALKTKNESMEKKISQLSHYVRAYSVDPSRISNSELAMGRIALDQYANLEMELRILRKDEKRNAALAEKAESENAALRETLQYIATAYDDEQALFELSRRLYDVSCVARKALGKEAQP